MSEIHAEIGEQIARLRVLWPVLNSRQEHTQEIEKAVMRHERKLTAQDVIGGFSDAIEACPTTGWPPGPHEVLGCVMARAHTRKVTTPSAPRRFGGMTFHEWWASVPRSERGRHAVLHKMMTGTQPVLASMDGTSMPADRSTHDDADDAVPKPVPATPMPDDDEIEWEEAA